MVCTAATGDKVPGQRSLHGEGADVQSLAGQQQQQQQDIASTFDEARSPASMALKQHHTAPSAKYMKPSQHLSMQATSPA